MFELLREQLWYKPNVGIYVKLIVMLGKCKQPEKAHELFQEMINEGCVVNHEVYTALLSAYSRSGRFDAAFTLLERMKSSHNCQPDVHTYSILIKSFLQVFAFDKVQDLLSDMRRQGIRPNTITYNTLIDAYGKAKMYLASCPVLLNFLQFVISICTNSITCNLSWLQIGVFENLVCLSFCSNRELYTCWDGVNT